MANVRCWDYADGALAAADFDALVARMDAVIRELRPDTVITFGPDGGYGHPDHIAVSAAATAACRRVGEIAHHSDQLEAGREVHRPCRLYHRSFPSRDVLLMKRLARGWRLAPRVSAGRSSSPTLCS